MEADELEKLSTKGHIIKDIEARAFFHIYEWYNYDTSRNERSEIPLTQDEVLVILGLKKQRALELAKSIDDIATEVVK